jgi:hypothetical protein
METVTGKRLGRPRKMLAVPNAIAEGENTSAINDGNGQAGRVGATPQAGAIRQGAGWDGFVDGVKALHALTGYKLRNVYHPKPGASVIKHENGSINVFVGDVRGTLSDGSTVAI